ncbi:MAG: hypothetical protein JSS09_04475, partial [Verrucomicrobia bacterium]|nr:hypothetical protein [Verrucomicrobiota bacterium]
MTVPTAPTLPTIPSTILTVPSAPLSLTTSGANNGATPCPIDDSENTLLTIFNQLITDCNSILLSRYQMQADNT